ncbi:MAG: 50S ribosomal protein L6 [Candidatus Izemoplasmatales bacterium]|jgi:large subunit ribosomal protein L6|nr:50S ribosomal protein L6 [Candidatus Izemoplasmatales bacterium]HPE00091.1 50S ribosomal protein L6 [Bacillota bacterium]
MSRIGNQSIKVPAGVSLNIDANNNVIVKGPLGELSFTFNKNIGIKVENDEISVTRPNDSLRIKALHGTTRALLNNMVIGVSEGYTKILDIKGVGYRAQLKDPKTLVLNVGYSNPVEMEIPEGLTIDIPKNTEVHVKGANKQMVGEFAANIRKVRQPEPYLGKGIRYRDEHVRRKEGKTAK